jgi:hypothetical protein
MLGTLLDLLGVVCLASLAWFVWEPLPLGVVGVAALVMSWQRRA